MNEPMLTCKYPTLTQKLNRLLIVSTLLATVDGEKVSCKRLTQSCKSSRVTSARGLPMKSTFLRCRAAVTDLSSRAFVAQPDEKNLWIACRVGDWVHWREPKFNNIEPFVELIR